MTRSDQKWQEVIAIALTAELQELPVMSETAQITSFGQDGQSVDRADPRD